MKAFHEDEQCNQHLLNLFDLRIEINYWKRFIHGLLSLNVAALAIFVKTRCNRAISLLFSSRKRVNIMAWSAVNGAPPPGISTSTVAPNIFRAFYMSIKFKIAYHQFEIVPIRNRHYRLRMMALLCQYSDYHDEILSKKE